MKQVTPKAARTPWFSGKATPARPGVYERDFGHGGSPVYSYWSGTLWFMAARTPQAAAWSVVSSPYQKKSKVRWRGLASRPRSSR